MGDVFETTMPEQVYTDKISDLESRLHEVEMILAKYIIKIDKKRSEDTYNEAKTYFNKYKSK
tara:strand:+ start:314 stop:499 length:186 start_codon:yes stop_codon:yes gene_type:complete